MKPIIVMIIICKFISYDGSGVAKIDGWSSMDACNRAVPLYSGYHATPTEQRDYANQAFCVEVK